MRKRKPVMKGIAIMDETAQNRFRTLLRARLDEIESADALGKQGQETVQLDQQSVGRLSRQDALLNQSMAKANQNRRTNEAQRLRLALTRLEEGDYGFCTDCGEEIAAKRLELDPATPKCISCARG